jgi:outer membrane protein TolC
MSGAIETTELQEARRRWLDAEVRAIRAEEKCGRLEATIYELHGKLIQRAMDTVVAQINTPWNAFGEELRNEK